MQLPLMPDRAMQVTVSSASEGGDLGQPLHSASFKRPPAQIQFSHRGCSAGIDHQLQTPLKLSVDVGSRTLYVATFQPEVCAGEQPTGQEQPLELTFQERYGSIRCHTWFGDNMLLVGFASGWWTQLALPNKSCVRRAVSAPAQNYGHAGQVLIVSTEVRQVGVELHSQCYCPAGGVQALALCPAQPRAAVASSAAIRVLALPEAAQADPSCSWHTSPRWPRLLTV